MRLTYMTPEQTARLRKLRKAIEGWMGRKLTPVERGALWRRELDPTQLAALNAAIAARRPSRAGCAGEKRRSYASSVRRYGLTPQGVEALYEQQGGLCACCGAAIEQHGASKHVHIDHCHTTGTVRGILCSSCNLMIGFARESTAHLRAGIAYLEKWK